MFFQNLVSNYYVFEQMNVHLTVFKLNYLLLHSTACFFVWIYVAASHSKYGYWFLNHANAHIKFTMQWNTKPKFFLQKPTETDCQQIFWNRSNTSKNALKHHLPSCQVSQAAEAVPQAVLVHQHQIPARKLSALWSCIKVQSLSCTLFHTTGQSTTF